MNRILCHHPGVWKRCVRWMSYQLTEEQKRGRVEWCLHSFRKPSNCLLSGFSQVRTHLWNWRAREALPNRWSRPSSPDPVMWPLFRSRRGQRRAVHQHLPAQGHRGLECKPSKQRQPLPAAPPRQLKCPHLRRHSWLPGSESRSAGHPDPLFPRLSPLWFLSVPSSEAAIEVEVVSRHRRCWSLFRGCDFWHASVNVVLRHGHVVWKDD